MILNCRWYYIILSVHALSGNKSDYKKVSFYKKLEDVFGQFCKYHMNILLGDFNAKIRS